MDKIKNLETRMNRVEKALKLNKIKQGIEVKCSKCGHVINTRSKLDLITCTNCSKKTKNTSIKKKVKIKFDAFEGKRYKDYDDLEMKKELFKESKIIKCTNCKKKIDKISDGYIEYKFLFCKKCFAKVHKENDEELSRAFKEAGI